MYDEIKKLPKILLHCHLDGSVSKELLKIENNQIRIPEDKFFLGNIVWREFV